jgi:hypothetical protein
MHPQLKKPRVQLKNAIFMQLLAMSIEDTALCWCPWWLAKLGAGLACQHVQCLGLPVLGALVGHCPDTQLVSSQSQEMLAAAAVSMVRFSNTSAMQSCADHVDGRSGPWTQCRASAHVWC